MRAKLSTAKAVLIQLLHRAFYKFWKNSFCPSLKRSFRFDQCYKSTPTCYQCKMFIMGDSSRLITAALQNLNASRVVEWQYRLDGMAFSHLRYWSIESDQLFDLNDACTMLRKCLLAFKDTPFSLLMVYKP